MVEPAASPSSAARRRHWRATRRLTVVLLVAWFLIGFVVAWFARDLSFDFFGWPFSFWVAAQGAGIGFVAIIVAYCVAMHRFDLTLAEDLAAEASAKAEAREGRGAHGAPAR
jgi:putative solute:sodium symporter small subunit